MKAQSTLHKYESPVKITQVYNLAKLRKRKNNYTIQPILVSPPYGLPPPRLKMKKTLTPVKKKFSE